MSIYGFEHAASAIATGEVAVVCYIEVKKHNRHPPEDQRVVQQYVHGKAINTLKGTCTPYKGGSQFVIMNTACAYLPGM